MEDQSVSFETAKLAKEKGFNWLCEELYYDDGESDYIGNCNGVDEDKFLSYSKPTQTTLQKWLREVHNIHVDSNPLENDGKHWEYKICNIILTEESNLDYDSSFEDKLFPIYEEALETGLLTALKLIK